MAALVDGAVNSDHATGDSSYEPLRYSAVPRSIEIPISGGEGEEAVEVDLEELLDDPTELCTLLENENVTRTYWTTIALAYAKTNKIDLAIDIINRGLAALDREKPNEKLYLYNCLCWLFFTKSRTAHRLRPDAIHDGELKIKDDYLKAATAALNDASRIDPSFQPLSLARGVLYLLRAPLIQDLPQRGDMFNQAIRAFDETVKSSGGKNLAALLGRARAQYAFRKYADALHSYQMVLQKVPAFIDADPRIGIGCCSWQLGYKDDAKDAWERALELNPQSKSANLLLGLHYLHQSSQYSTSDPKFAPLYKEAMVKHTQQSFKIDNEFPPACSTFGSFFMVRKSWSTVESLARKAIELAEINAIISDGWYLLARKEHSTDNMSNAVESYTRADQARGGDDRGYTPAKLGIAQLRAAQGDLDSAKFRLEKMQAQSSQQHNGKNGGPEAMALLGALIANEVFTEKADASEARASATKRAIALLETVRRSWGDSKSGLQPEAPVLINLARLLESEGPERSLLCLQQVEQMQLDDVPENLRPTEPEGEASWLFQMRQHVLPELLNNMGCFHYRAERYNQASVLFQTALSSCSAKRKDEDEVDEDALITTISFNLARTYEAENMLDEARKVYQGLLERHPQYLDANLRLAFIELQLNPSKESTEKISKLQEAHSNDLEVRSLYGWFLRRAKRRANNVNEDQEQRYLKHTLQHHDKHDHYALTGIGNVFLVTAREMRRNTKEEKERRSAMYAKAVESFDKALQLDPKNAHAAQGIAIALIEDGRDSRTALQLLSQLKDTIKGPSVFINLGHCFAEGGFWARAIESYEAALARDHTHDISILVCLGRVWSLRGGKERKVLYLRHALEYCRRVLEASPQQEHYQFNAAMVQQQIAQTLVMTPAIYRNTEDLKEAAEDLEESLKLLESITQNPQATLPRRMLDSYISKGRKELRPLLDRAIRNQTEYDNANVERLQQARKQRDLEMAKRAEEKRKQEEAQKERRRQIAEERKQMQERDRQLAEQRAEEERKRLEEQEQDAQSLDEDGKVKKSKKSRRQTGKRKKKSEEFVVDSDVEDGEDGEQRQDVSSVTPAPQSDVELPRKKKKRRLERKSKATQYKSAERIVDSDEDDAPTLPPDEAENSAHDGDTPMPDIDGEEQGEEASTGPPPVKRSNRVVDEDEEDVPVGADTPEDGNAPINGDLFGDDSE